MHPESFKSQFFNKGIAIINPGISATKLTSLGSWLSLSLSYDIMEKCGGEIKLESEERKGTNFIIMLPNA